MNQATNRPSNKIPAQAFTPRFVAESLGLPLDQIAPNHRNHPFPAITTDSRKIQNGCLFVALPGEKFDGHDFISAAINQGARGILCRKGFKPAPQARGSEHLCIFEVDDTLKAYRQIGAAWRKLFSIPMICVAGSAGKTTTKEILTAILRGKWPQVLKTQGSQNGFVGIPITLLELTAEHQAAVIEIGIDEPGAMQQHMELVQPTCSILTAIGPEHLEKLIDLPTVAREETISLSWVAHSHWSEKLVVIQLDDPWIRPHWEKLHQGKKLGCTFDAQVKNSLPSRDNIFLGTLSSMTVLEVTGPGFAGEKFDLPLPGSHNARNLLGAIALAAGLGLSAAEIRAGLALFKGAEGRSELRELPGSTPVICDYYNAQPVSMEAGLDLLAQIAKPWSRTRWACLGDMLEMGAEEERLHRELAGKIISIGIENILLYGPRMKFLEDELKKRTAKGRFHHFPTHAALAQALTEGVRPGDAVLIKGSRGMRMEEIWKILETHALRAFPAPITAPGAGKNS